MPMAVQLMTNVKLWSTVTRGGGEMTMIGDPDMDGTIMVTKLGM